MIGMWCTPEIETALRLGYTLKTIYKVYKWEETTQYTPNTRQGGLFAQYIHTFLKFKQEASGPPDENMTTYIQEYAQKEGVSLSREHCEEPVIESPGRIVPQ